MGTFLLSNIGIIIPAIIGFFIFIFFLRSSIVIAGGDETIHLERKYLGKPMPDGRTVALAGEVGVQAKILGPGIHFLVPFLYRNWKEKFLVIQKNQMGTVRAITGAPIPSGRIMAKHVDCDLFQDGEKFLLAGGEKGPQLAILPEGEYKINRHLFDVVIEDVVEIADNEVGCIEAIDGAVVQRAGGNFGKPVECDSFQDANAFIQNGGEKGPQIAFLVPGYYRINRILFSLRKEKIVEIPGGKIGLIEAADGAPIPDGRLLGKKIDGHKSFFDGQAFIQNGGEKGRQLEALMPGRYRINTTLFKVIQIADWTLIQSEQVGIVTVNEGKPIIDPTKIAAEELPLDTHSNFQNAAAFIAAGGQKGLQIPVLRAGNYAINPWFATIDKVDMVRVEIGYCGVVTSFVGEDGEDTTDEKVNAKIVKNGCKGIWADPLQPGKHPLNTRICKVDIVPTTQILLNWADNTNSSHALDANLKTITLRTADAFNVNMDVSVIIHIQMPNAPKVIANLGSVNNMISQVLEPAISSHFRNAAQYIKALDLYTERKELQEKAKTHITEVLKIHHIDSKETLIADVVLPSELVKPVTDRQIAVQEKITYETKKLAQDERKNLENATANADMQKEIVKSERGVDIAKFNKNAKIESAEGDKQSAILKAQGEKESSILKAAGQSEATKLNADADSQKITKVGKAEAEIILEKGKSTAKSYELEVAAMGKEVFGRIRVIKEISNSSLKLIPDNLVIGGGEGGGSMLESYLGIGLMEKLSGEKFPSKLPAKEEVKTEVKIEEKKDDAKIEEKKDEKKS